MRISEYSEWEVQQCVLYNMAEKELQHSTDARSRSRPDGIALWREKGNLGIWESGIACVLRNQALFGGWANVLVFWQSSLHCLKNALPCIACIRVPWLPYC